MPKNQSTSAIHSAPHSVESEQTLLGSVIIGEHQYLHMLTPAHFYDPVYGKIWHTMQEIQKAGKEPDFLEVCNALVGDEKIQQIGGSAFIAQLCSSVVTTSLAPSAVRIIQEHYSRRVTIDAGKKLAMLANESEQDVMQLPQLMAEASQKIAEIIPRPLTVDKDAIIADILTVGDKISTGFKQMDMLLEGGIEGGWVFLVAARPSVGKSAMAATMMANFLKAGVPVSMISLEMSQKQVMKRMLSAYYETFPAEILEKADELVRRIETPYFISENGDISAVLQEIYTSPAKVVIIDYFGLISMKTKEGSVEKLDEISRSIKRAAMKSGKAIIMLWQLNRDLEKDKANRQPRLSDLYGGGEKDPDIISFLHDPSAKDEMGTDSMTIKEAMAVENPVKELEWIVRKNRHGATGYMKLRFEQKKSLMVEDLSPFVSKPKKEPAQDYRKRKNPEEEFTSDRAW